MANEKRIEMSLEQLNKLKEELEYLQTVRTKEVAEELKLARSYGDLSENSEYDEAKTNQGKVYTRIAEVQNLIDNAVIVENSSNTDVVGNGSLVTVRDIDIDEIEQYQIVGSQEADPMNGKLSKESPFGMSLMGKKVGDIVDVQAPVGVLKFEIVKIEASDN